MYYSIAVALVMNFNIQSVIFLQKSYMLTFPM